MEVKRRGRHRYGSVTSARTGEELLRQKSRSRSVGGSPLESPRGSKLVNQNSTVQNSRCQRQRSFRRSEDDVKRSRSQSLAYELSQDLQEKQVEMLERKYGGSIRSRRAAKIIQRAFRQYCMNKNFEKMRIAVGERRLSKRLSEVGRSNTVWTDRLSADSHFINNASVIQSNGDVKRHSADVPQNGSLKRISDYDPIKRGENKVKHQRSLDPNASRKEISQRNSLTNRDKLKRLVRTKEVEIDNSDIQINQNDLKKKPAVVDETNNNRNSCPEMNESSASDSPQPTPVESTIDLHSLDFETLVESKETDILTDSFHNEGLHCDPEIVNTLGYHKPSSASLFSNASTDTLDSNKSQVSTYDNFRSNNSDSGSFGSQGDIQIKIDHVSLDDTIRTPEQKEMADQTLRYYQNQEVKMRSRNSMENIAKKPPVVPVRAPEASPIWKRKNVPNGGPPPPPAVKILEPKRMSNISETSEDTSVDGHYSSSPSSENISAENLSIVNETLTYQRKLRLSVTPDHSHTIPKTADKYRKRIYRIGLNFFNKKPDKGIQFLCEHGFIDESPSVVAKFLITRKGLSKQMIGEYLGNLQNEFNMEVLHYFAEAIDLAGLQVDMALRKFQSYFRMPGEAQKIERLMEAFAQRYCYCNPDQIKSFKNPDTIFLLAFAIIMLNTDLHNRSIKQERKMKLEDFVKNLRGIDDGEDVDKDLLMGIYDRIQAQEFRHGVDHVTQVLKVEQTIVGKRPFSTLALPHRRLVCYCRLYEVHDPNKKEKIGLHQREVFLFNDFLLVTKIFSKKKTGITYSYKTSFSLSGMQVFLFETSHYHFGIRLTSSIDSKVLITFNSRNDHDRQKFVEDLKEAILESNGMEQLRIEEELHRHSTTHNTIDRHYATDDTRVLMYELMKPSDPAVNRLSAPECGGLKKIPLSNSLTDLCEAQGMKRGSSGGSLDSGVASGGSAGVNSSGDSFVTQTSQTSLLSSKGPSSSSLVSGNHIGIRGRGGKLSSSSLGQALPEGTEV